MEKLFWCVVSGVIVLAWQVQTGELQLEGNAETVTQAPTAALVQ